MQTLRPGDPERSDGSRSCCEVPDLSPGARRHRFGSGRRRTADQGL